MLYEWKLHGVTRNFGDSLGELLATKEQIIDKDKMYMLVGSVICNFVMDEVLRQGYKPVFIDCGWRGEDLDHDMIKQCEFIGARGPDTQAELRWHGINVNVTKDSGYKIPSVVIKAKYSGDVIAIPHIEDYKTLRMDPEDLGVNEIVLPAVTDRQSIVRLIDKISSAQFVLAGSLHAAIIAHAYSVKFAPLNTGYINCLPKWIDWSKSIGIAEFSFAKDFGSGYKWYHRNLP